MSFLQRLWHFVRLNRPARIVGRDLEGNTYFERPNPNNPGRTRRSVKYYEEQDMWRYIGGERRLAVQWSSWLSHTRAHPPTLEELEADAARLQRVRYNAAMIEAKERQEREQALRIGGGVPPAINDSDHKPTQHLSPPQGEALNTSARTDSQGVQAVESQPQYASPSSPLSQGVSPHDAPDTGHRHASRSSPGAVGAGAPGSWMPRAGSRGG